MTDDVQNDPTAPAEPRSAVEAAADPAHGGGQVSQQGRFVNSLAGQQLGQAQFGQATAQQGLLQAHPYMQAMQAQQAAQMQASGNLNSAPKPPAPTIMSGIQRLQELVKQGETMIAAGREFVEAMEGAPKPAATGTAQSPAESGTAAVLHTAIHDVSNVLWQMHSLLGRAKAAHG